MRLTFLSTVLLAVPLAFAALVYGRAHVGCCASAGPSATPKTSDGSECCAQEKKAAAPKRTGKAEAGPIDPGRQLVFKVEGLTCPAVKGLGCGHILQGVLESLDKLDGAEAGSANYTGTMIRISVTTGIDRDKVAEAARKALTEGGRAAVRLAGDELKRALDQEEWRGAGRIGELSAIEFRTLALHRFKIFAKTEQLDKKTADKLVEIAEQQWERLSKEAEADGATRPEDWGRRIKASLPAFLDRAKGLLTAEQLMRFESALKTPCRGDDRPEAPPAPSSQVKCSRTPDQLAAERDQLLPGLFRRAGRVADITDGLRFRFTHSPGLVADLAAVIEKERACCPFLTFRLVAEAGEGPIMLEVSGPPGTGEMLRKLQAAGGRRQDNNRVLIQE
jgi:hypothetical protein